MSNTNSGRPAVLGGGRKVDRVALLEKVAELGSISAAAKAAGVSYKGAWEAIEALNNLSAAPVVERLVGGSGGGGPVSGEIVIDLPGGKSVAATITRDSIDSLGLKEGAPACALIKAAHVILAIAN